MSGSKRRSSLLSEKLLKTESPFSPAVTLFTLPPDDQVGFHESPRRSKRVKTEHTESSGVLGTSETYPASPGPTTRPPKTSKRVKIKVADVEDLVLSSPTKRKALSAGSSSPRKTKLYKEALKTPHPAPDNWKEVYDLIHEMRSAMIAPVDTMGCEMAHFEGDDPKNRRFTTLVSLMLSSQTKDEVTDNAVKQLRSALGGTISVAAVIDADDQTISDAINKVGFWRRKTQYIQQTAKRLQDDFESDIPQTADELCSLPGVGPKMAFLALQVAWKLNLGIGVDVHVHRITNRLGWHKPPTKTPEDTRINLESWLPKDLHPKINHMLVGFGQVLCTPQRPRCEDCTLSSQRLCPSAITTKTKGEKTTGVKVASPAVEVTLEEDK